MPKIRIEVIKTCRDCPSYVFQCGGTGLCLSWWRQIHKKGEQPKIPEWCWLPEMNENITVKQAIQNEKEAAEKAKQRSKELKKRRKKN